MPGLPAALSLIAGATRVAARRVALAVLLLSFAACQDPAPDAVPPVARDLRPPPDEPLLFPADAQPRLLTLADETGALGSDELGGPADGSWWAVTGDPAATSGCSQRAVTYREVAIHARSAC